MNRPFLIALAFCCATLQACHKPELEQVTVEQVIERLQENAEQAYGCEIKSAVCTYRFSEADLVLVYDEVEFLHESKWVSSTLASSWLDGYWTGTYFEKRVNFLNHVLDQDRYGELPEWRCDSFRKSATPLLGRDIYTRRDWSYSGQASALLIDFPPSAISVVDDELILSWESVPNELSLEMLNHLPFRRNEKDSDGISIDHLSLGVDYEQGFPSSFKINLSNGESSEQSFANFELLGDTYRTRSRELRTRLNVSEYIRCWCDGEIYNVGIGRPW